MKRKLLTCLGALCLAPCAGMVLAQAPHIIESTVEARQGPPLWISASAVADSKKIINLDLVDALTLRRNIEKQTRALQDGPRAEMLQVGEQPPISDIPLSDCKSELATFDHRGGDAPSSTLAELTAYSQSIFWGTVVSVERGFSFGTPSSLLEIDVGEVIKGSLPGSRIYVDYLVARFRIGRYYFCNANKGYEPSPGDQVLLFDYVGPADREGVYYAPRLDQLFFQNKKGGLFISPQFKNDPDLKNVESMGEFLTILRTEIGSGANLKRGAQWQR